jgi:hypothetical protein
MGRFFIVGQRNFATMKASKPSDRESLIFQHLTANWRHLLALPSAKAQAGTRGEDGQDRRRIK